MASKMGSGQPGLVSLFFLPLCVLFSTLSSASPGGCSHCPFLLSCLLPSPLVLTGGKWQPQLLCLLGLGPAGRYHCQTLFSTLRPPPFQGMATLGEAVVLVWACLFRVTCATERRPISTSIRTGTLAMEEKLLPDLAWISLSGPKEGENVDATQ